MSRTVLIEADLSMKEPIQGAAEQALTPASTTLGNDRLGVAVGTGQAPPDPSVNPTASLS